MGDSPVEEFHVVTGRCFCVNVRSFCNGGGTQELERELGGHLDNARIPELPKS